MKNQPLILLVALALLAAACGCSLKVDLADENTTEKSRVAVEVGFLVDRESEPEPAPPTASEESKTVEPAREPASPPATPEPLSRGAEDVKPADRRSVFVVKNVINIQHLDVHRHHYHFYEPPRSRESAKVRVEVGQKSKRSELCEKLMREHLKTVAEWEAMFQ